MSTPASDALSTDLGTFRAFLVFDWVALLASEERTLPMNGIIYLVGLVVVVMLILSFFGLR
jgi:hypothetical protein